MCGVLTSAVCVVYVDELQASSLLQQLGFVDLYKVIQITNKIVLSLQVPRMIFFKHVKRLVKGEDHVRRSMVVWSLKGEPLNAVHLALSDLYVSIVE
jgi:hypothetical protein